MRILSWNILASEWIKKSYYKDVNHAILFNRNERFEQIIELIKSTNADIILLQEVMPEERLQFMKLLGHTYIISPIQRIAWQYQNNSKSGNMTMLKRNPFSNHDVHHFSKEYGIYTQCIHNNTKCDIINLHLDDISRTTRHKQMEDAYKILRRGKYVHIIGGDFNHIYRKDSKLYHQYGFDVHNTCVTYCDKRNINIDNILTRGARKYSESKCYAMPASISECISNYGSDHLPVITDIIVKE